ncbi:lysozyme [Nodosilinea sp. LEGE 07298]|jgi:GH24 family phage-related lysozyme (muramidase)|uniref:lysozyme n=1 Tax=Nodosilinea sp. LEGE 07298 TaxID=2777970 RepID=UPI00187E07FB|nr:lysozyme [Nodosilinea sp. LEGE 07298]MBE9112080.1 lysozyme [Nodosilinea sp. LEGE 07298]
MGTWIKETDIAIYLMQGGYWVSRITKYPSSNNPKEQVVNIGSIKSWFLRDDYPRAMTVSIGTGAPEPQPMPPPPPPPPQPSNTINAAGLEIVRGFEGLGLSAYPDPGTGGEPWTIGYGHTSAAGPPQVYRGLVITRAEAEEILKRDLAKYEKAVANAVTRTPTSDQFSALVSFTFNVGPGNFQTSTLLRKHNAGDFAGASEEFGRWVYAGGNVMPGLQRRRRAERALYRSENWQQFM